MPDGRHTFAVRATNDVGTGAPATATWNVDDTTQPTAKLISWLNRGPTPESVELDASESSDPFGGTILDYQWDPTGDGSFSVDTGANPTMTWTYPNNGESYLPRVKVTDALGLSAIATWPVFALPPTPPAGYLGVSINNGDYATNDPHVTLDLVWNQGAYDALVSNDGGFNAADSTQTLPLAAAMPWTLEQTGSDRLPKTVYVRFTGYDRNPFLETYTDDIILDETAPTVTAATVTPPATNAVTAIAAAKRKPETAGYRIKLKAKDGIVGVCAAQASAQRSGGKTTTITNCRRRGLLTVSRTFTVKAIKSPRYVRVKNSAGSWSRWFKLARKRKHN